MTQSSTPHSSTVLTLRFPEICLPVREGRRLRGYFGTAFRESNPLLHNHLQDGTTRQGYSLVQYKIIKGTPTIVGIDAGAQALLEVFTRIEEIRIGEQNYAVANKDLQQQRFEIALLPDRLTAYKLLTPYCALNQENYAKYRQLASDEARHALLCQQLSNHLLAVCKGLGYYASSPIVAYPFFGAPGLTSMKGTRLTGFRGHFVTNLRLPDGIGIGKSTARGYGTIEKIRPQSGLLANSRRNQQKEEE